MSDKAQVTLLMEKIAAMVNDWKASGVDLPRLCEALGDAEWQIRRAQSLAGQDPQFSGCGHG